MKICWDNLEGLYLTRNRNFRSKTKNKTFYLKECRKCNEEYLGDKKSCFCSNICAKKDHIVTNEVREKISNSNKGKNKGRFLKEKSSFWKGGYYLKNIPTYDTYAYQIDWIEECRRNVNDSNILEVKCAYCGKWFVPTRNNVTHRIQYLKGNKKYKGEHKFYCSDGCKKECPIYGKQPLWIEREDAIRVGRLYWTELNREVQPELRQMVFERDKYACQKCENTEHLHCHHILPASIEPIESADIDNCITYCKKCHKEVHQKDGCRYRQLKICA